MPIVRVVSGNDRSEVLLGEISELYSIVLRIARHVQDSNEPMTATQRLALIEVSRSGPLRLSHLAHLMETTPATATRAVDALEEWGYVVRQPAPDDRRGILVTTRPRGKRWAERRRARLQQTLEQLPASAVPPRLVDDMARLNAGLRRVTGHDETARSSLLGP
jgi:MarR family transcriptional regulator, transcriptional regulator for hemolysin